VRDSSRRRAAVQRLNGPPAIHGFWPRHAGASQSRRCFVCLARLGLREAVGAINAGSPSRPAMGRERRKHSETTMQAAALNILGRRGTRDAPYHLATEICSTGCMSRDLVLKPGHPGALAAHSGGHQPTDAHRVTVTSPNRGAELRRCYGSCVATNHNKRWSFYGKRAGYPSASSRMSNLASAKCAACTDRSGFMKRRAPTNSNVHNPRC
jgi:hypothetical protein